MSVGLIAFALSLPLSWAAVALILPWLRARQILDHPNERSSHARPTPRGGGLAITPVILLSWLALTLAGHGLPGQATLMAGALGLLILSWRDDRASLPASLRLALQGLAVLAGLLALPAGMLLFQGVLPWWADRLLAGLAWLWFLNLYNFMDGIDGITGIETLCLAAGLIALDQAVPQAAVLAAASLGFLAWNWHPAKIFLGDSGSVPLGYLLGWLLLTLAGHGHPAAALILPAYYLADATFTLVKRASRLEPVWQAHRQHFYQQAVQGGASHATVSRLILAGNILLLGAAWWSERAPWPALAAAGATTAGLLLLLRALGRRQRS
jgi:UDP-N-acetylmuramyl pentapeptide phosphotransferase/UDP-N-acetylglucosamine-1-phosphate transferase